MICKKCGSSIGDNSIFCSFCGKKQVSTKQKRNRRVNGTGGIRKLSGNRNKPYAAIITHNGEQKYMGTFATEKECSLFLQKLDIENASNRINWSLGQFYELWQTTNDYISLSQSAKQAYQAAWNRLAILANEKMRNLKTSDYQEIVNNAVKVRRYKKRNFKELSKMSKSEQERYKQLESKPDEALGFDGKKDIKELTGFLCRLALKDDVINKNYGSLIDIELIEENKAEKINLTAEQLSIITDNDNLIAAKITLIFVYTGFRANELLKLKKSDVDLENGIIHGGSKTDAGKNRRIPIHSLIISYITDFYNTATECDYLITQNGHRIKYDSFTRTMFYPMLDDLGIKRQDENGRNILTLHRTRHTWVQMAVESGMAPEALKKIAGHAKYETSIDKYDDQTSTEYLVKEMKKI